MKTEYLKEEREVLLDCLERNSLNGFPYDLSKFWNRIEQINEELR